MPVVGFVNSRSRETSAHLDAAFRKGLNATGYVDGQNVTFVGAVDDTQKSDLLGRACALLFPTHWEETFGLVMVEAMACGTPVIAFRSGSVPEVVDDGITGFIVDGEAQAVAAVGRLGELDRHQVRSRFEDRFTSRRMAEQYVGHYEKLRAAAPKPGGH